MLEMEIVEDGLLVDVETRCTDALVLTRILAFVFPVIVNTAIIAH
jgi:hypothetical protein